MSLMSKLFKKYSLYRCKEIYYYMDNNLLRDNEVSKKYSQLYSINRMSFNTHYNYLDNFDYKHIRVYRYSIWLKISSDRFIKVWDSDDGFICKGSDSDPWKQTLYSDWRELVDLYCDMKKELEIYEENERKRLEEYYKRKEREKCKENLYKLNEVYK